jgi:hypothetical protein
MGALKGPLEAITRLLAEELRQVIIALPANLQASLPEQLKLDSGLTGEEVDTPHGDG